MVTSLPEKVDLNGYYTQTQAAKLLGVSYFSVHRWISYKLIETVMSRRTSVPLIKGKEIVRFYNNR